MRLFAWIRTQRRRAAHLERIRRAEEETAPLFARVADVESRMALVEERLGILREGLRRAT